MSEARIAQKWGFGMAPVKAHTQRKREKAVTLLLASFDSDATDSDLAEAISEVKGLFNRISRMDQWDWFTVYLELGMPSPPKSRKIAGLLGDFRKCITGKSDADVDQIKLELKILHMNYFCTGFPRDTNAAPVHAETVYILSTREQPDVLKIGFTSRSVLQRVKEINASTGVLVPFGVRKIWVVSSGRDIEKKIHAAFDDCRIRKDREFFNCDFYSAVKRINHLLTQDNG